VRALVVDAHVEARLVLSFILADILARQRSRILRLRQLLAILGKARIVDCNLLIVVDLQLDLVGILALDHHVLVKEHLLLLLVEALADLCLFEVLVIGYWPGGIDILSLAALLYRGALLEVVVRGVEVFVVNEWHAAYNSTGSYLDGVVDARQRLPLLHFPVAIKDAVTIFLHSVLYKVALHVAD
jgi:hypothetical protein